MNKQKSKLLLDRYSQGELSPEQQLRLNEWYLTTVAESREALSPAQLENSYDYLRANLPVLTPVKRVKLWARVATIAAILAMIGMCVYLFNYNKSAPISSNGVAYKNDVAPGKYGATLTLANGKKIYINETSAGALAQAAGVTISKTADGKIVYTANGGKDGVVEYNTLETQNGEQTQIILPDKSIVFLNAASSLKYPSTFGKLKERAVRLTGEAYFEVSKDKERPFIVKTSNQQVKVLGTHFNINNYADEGAAKTTLLEGSVMVSPVHATSLRGETMLMSAVTLKPGQMAVNNGSLTVTEADTELAVAWKNGEFHFDQTPLESVMRQIARWYDVKIVYENEQVKQQTIGGTVTRYGKVSQILNAISTVGNVQFQINHKTITVK